ncbi:Rubredoxin, partial [Dysosmobacter welbionis]
PNLPPAPVGSPHPHISPDPHRAVSVWGGCPQSYRGEKGLLFRQSWRCSRPFR